MLSIVHMLAPCICRMETTKYSHFFHVQLCVYSSGYLCLSTYIIKVTVLIVDLWVKTYPD